MFTTLKATELNFGLQIQNEKGQPDKDVSLTGKTRKINTGGMRYYEAKENCR